MNRAPVAIPSQGVTVAVPPASPVPAGNPPLRVAPPAARPLPVAPVPVNANDARGPRTTSPASPSAGANPVYVPPVRTDARPRMQPSPAPVAVMPSGPAVQRGAAPSLPRERVAAPATLAPAPSAAPPAGHPASAAPAPRGLPVSPAAAAPAGRPGEPRVERPVAPAARVPAEGLAKP
jgi:hypothetical protein